VLTAENGAVEGRLARELEKLAKEDDKLPYPYPYLTPTHALPLAWPCP